MFPDKVGIETFMGERHERRGKMIDAKLAGDMFDSAHELPPVRSNLT
jgi:hypothetical protein